MNDPKAAPKYESIALRILWMLVFALVWQVAQFLLGALVVVQLIYRLVYGAPNLGLMNFGDSLSQFLAQIGRFGSFHTRAKALAIRRLANAARAGRRSRPQRAASAAPGAR